jgi:ATP-dependent helicase/nuclease subunit A
MSSTLPFLTLIPAGAGSGKTYRIKEQLAEWVKNGQVQPDRIAAVTFTDSAASELRGRIRTALMDHGRLEDALRLDQSFISTIHGFGRRLLVEYAFEAGACPAPRLLGADEEQLLLRKAVARIDRIEPLSRNLFIFGYSYDFHSGRTDVEQFRQRLLATIHLLRIIGGDVNRQDRLEHCLDYIDNTYGPTDDAKALTVALRRNVKSLLKRYPNCMRDFVNSASAKNLVENDHRNLQRAVKDNALRNNWKLWKSLQTMKVFKKNDQLPENYQEMAHDVMACACELYRHPGPLEDALQHGKILMKSAWDALSDYADRKMRKGIIDYTDMIDGARRILEQPNVLEHLASRFDCLVIDEFQDTNPLQFSLLWKLHNAGVPALIVGDLKQSIMGFQSADPRLMGSLLTQYPEQCFPLDSNWRFEAKLMNVINSFGSQLFGDAYKPLKPKADYSSQLRPLEAICFEGKNINATVMAQHTAARIKEVISDDSLKVFDRHQERHRPIRGEDIAILGLTHDRLKKYAEALRQLGIRTRLAQDGWFESHPIQLAYYGLSFVADPQDKHAALYISVTELGEDNLTSATQACLKKEGFSLPLLKRLQNISSQQSDMTVDELVTNTLDAMELFDIVTEWPEASQARANLLRLLAMAREFVTADREALAGGGFYGSGLKTFLSWLKTQINEKDGDRQPDAQVHDEDAVGLYTWHSAKGREWPVVVVATFDCDVETRLPSLDIQYTDFNDLDNILDNARLEFSPNFTARETKDQFKAPLDEKAKAEGKNLLYVALTRAREKLILEWPNNVQNSKNYKFWHLMRDAARADLRANELLLGSETFSCKVFTADKEPPLEFSVPDAKPEDYLPRKGRRALTEASIPDDRSQLFITPSKIHGKVENADDLTINTTEYGAPLNLDLSPGIERGLLIHRAFELLGQGVSQSIARNLLDINITDDDWVKIQEIFETFLTTLKKNFHPISLSWEVPIISQNHESSVISGTIDLLVATQDGYWIVDHKTEESKNLIDSFSYYFPQLKRYGQALVEGMNLPVKGFVIHWACLGSISNLHLCP